MHVFVWFILGTADRLLVAVVPAKDEAMAEIHHFFSTPTVDAFDEFTMEQLVLLVGHYEVSLFNSAKQALCDIGVQYKLLNNGLVTLNVHKRLMQSACVQVRKSGT